MTTRNLMGQVDGTNNPKPAESDFDERIFVPVRRRSATWMAGGSYAVVRRIRMLLDDWEKLTANGRRRSSDGASPTAPRSPAARRRPRSDLDKRGRGRQARDPGQRPRPGHRARDERGRRDAAPPVLVPRRDLATTAPRTPGCSSSAGRRTRCAGFIPVQRKLDRGDALSAFIRHEASGLFAVPGGPREGRVRGAAAAGGMTRPTARRCRGGTAASVGRTDVPRRLYGRTPGPPGPMSRAHALVRRPIRVTVCQPRATPISAPKAPSPRWPSVRFPKPPPVNSSRWSRCRPRWTRCGTGRPRPRSSPSRTPWRAGSARPSTS